MVTNSEDENPKYGAVSKRNVVHPSYSQGIVPSDYHLLCSLQYNFNRKSMNYVDEVRAVTEKYFLPKTAELSNRHLADLSD